MTATSLDKDPSPATTPSPAVEIRTDNWNNMVDILNGVSSEFINLAQPVASKTGSYIATIDDFLVLGDATSGGFTITLPSAAATGAVKKIMAFKKIDSTANKVTIDGNSSETIDGALTKALETENEILIIQSDGTNWRIIANYLAVYDNGLLKIKNPAGTFSMAIKVAAIAANRSATVPLITADDTFVMVDMAQSIKMKTLVDSNGNEVIIPVETASAVNELSAKNAATGNNPELQATGDDSDIGIKLVRKGTGKHEIQNCSIIIESTENRPSTTKAIASGVLDGTSASRIIVQAESASADVLDTISGMSDGDRVELLADAGDLITVTHDSGGNDSIHLKHKIDIFLSETVPLVLEQKGEELYEISGPEITKVELALGKPDDDLATGDNQATHIADMAGKLVKVKAYVDTVSSSGLPTFALRKNASDMLATDITIDASENSSLDATTPAAINSDGTETVAADDVVRVDCDVAGTGTKGAIITLWFENLSSE